MIGDFVKINSFSLEEGIPRPFTNQLVILSTPFEEEELQGCIGQGCQVILAKRTVNYEHIDSLFFLPAGTKALYVNDFPETVWESIDTLNQLGIDHIHYIPYYPGVHNVDRAEIAITPGEVDLIPEHVTRMINIGPRLIDITTVLQVLERFGLLNERGTEISEKYTRKIIELSKKLAKAHHESELLNQHLNRVLNGVHDGILAVDRERKITAFNQNLENLLKMKAPHVLGRPLEEVIRQPELISFILHESSQNDMVYTLQQTEMTVHRFYLEAEKSIVVTFKNAKETLEIARTLRSEFVKKGYVAKYRLSHIIGDSQALTETKRLAQRLAQTELTVLIQGESGTGKELFASAIHNESKRSGGPFLAVNFSALPEDLVESELFGYEEGAFTGARKGGKPGLFEQANGGTIFLDEIGDISLKLQARLLRVLQEKEIMPIGGSKIIPVDVRIIAATNKNLLKMIELGKFREDLYHRLKVLYLHLPSLRERKEDIEDLIHYFIDNAARRDVNIDPGVIDQLTQQEWFGNVRELKNTIDYMLAVCDDFSITMKDIPNESFFQRGIYHTLSIPEALPPAPPPAKESLPEDDDLQFILQTIHEYQKKAEAIGRKKIAEHSQSRPFPLSEQQIRKRMDTLEQLGYITKSKGRGGTKLTRDGLHHLSTTKKGGQ